MLQSSLKAPSRIDHDLFPLLTVRSCVSEADESRNGPRFCAEDKMSGAAYEVRSRKLDLERESTATTQAADGGSDNAQEKQRISDANLLIIRKQQARMDALLSASASGAVPPSVSLPIDIYIQEQPSTGDTYVASVDAFAGLSLGDIIRSGWGVMEEQVFLEILNAVESYGYASASLPPHGNLSCDAIKQLLIVRDGASEARQPSRWVVSDWLLLSDETACVYDADTFASDLEWMLQSSFAQLRISTSSAGAYLAAGQVEDVINETVGRIRGVLTRRVAGEATAATNTASPADAVVAASGEGVDSVTSLNAQAAEGSSGTENAGGDLSSSSCPANTAASADSAARTAGHRSEPAEATMATSSSSPATTPTKSGGARGTRNGTRQVRNSPRAMPDTGAGVGAGRDSTRNMSLKDKMAFHQAALRNEQMLVNRQRRINAPLPPRPTPAGNSARKAGVVPTYLAAGHEEDEEDDRCYDVHSRTVPPLTLPIEVKPSAYLTQGRRASAPANIRSTAGAKKLQSPRSARGPPGGGGGGEARTPRDLSRSSATTATTVTTPQTDTTKPSQTPYAQHQQQQQPQAVTPKKQSGTPRDQQRERLLDDVVNMAVMNQRRRGQCYRMQQEADRRRREERQHALAHNTSPRGNKALPQRTMPSLLERPRVVKSGGAGPTSTTGSSSSTNAGAGKGQQQQQQPSPLQSRATGAHRSGATTATSPTTASTHNTNTTAATHRQTAALPTPAEEWPATMSESPEPVPPSPHARRIVHPYVPPLATAAPASAGKVRTPLTTPRSRALVEAAQAGRGGRGTMRGGRGGVVGPAAAGAVVAGPTPTTRLLRPTVGQRWSTRAGEAQAAGAAKERRGAPPANPVRSARGNPGGANVGSARGAGGQRTATATSTHPLSARAKQASAAAPPPTKSSDATTQTSPAAGPEVPPTSSSPPQSPSAQLQPAPFVKPLPLSTLVRHRDPASGSPHASVSATAGPAAKLESSGALDASLKTGVDSVPPAARAPPKNAEDVAPGSQRASPRAPNTARPLPPQPAFSPRGYRRIASTGVLTQPRATKSSTLRSAAPLTSTVPHGGKRTPTPRSARRSGPADGMQENGNGTGRTKAGGVVAYSPQQRTRKASDVEGERAFAAVNRKPMQRLVPEKVRVTHSSTGHLQRTPRATPDSTTATPRGRNTVHQKTAATAAAGATAEKKKDASGAAPRRKSPLTLGRVRPVNETSPGILLRHQNRATKK